MRSCGWWLCFLLVIGPMSAVGGCTQIAVEGAQVRERKDVPRMVRVPDVRRRLLDDARAALDMARLGTGEVIESPSEQPPGSVTAQDPPPDSEAPAGSTVRLWVAVPLPTVTVPEVRGRPVGEARAVLVELRLRPGEPIDQPSDRQPGTVLEQEPAPGAQVERGTLVRLWVATAVPPIAVPDVRRRQLEEARTILLDAGLRPGEVRDSPSGEPPGLVLEQRPLPGAQVPRDTLVELWVAVEALTVRIPDVRGQPLEQARATLAGARLLSGDARGLTSDQRPGTVIAQDPLPGTPAQPGTLVNLWVAKSSEVPWTAVAIGGAAMAGVAAAGLHYRRVRTRRRLLSKLGSRLGRDPGQQHIYPQEFVPTQPGIRLRAVLDPGRQSLERDDLIKEQHDEHP